MRFVTYGLLPGFRRLYLENDIDLVVKLDGWQSAGFLRGDLYRIGFHHMYHRARLTVRGVVAHAVERAWCYVKTGCQRFRLMDSVIRRRVTCLVFIPCIYTLPVAQRSA